MSKQLFEQALTKATAQWTKTKRRAELRDKLYAVAVTLRTGGELDDGVTASLVNLAMAPPLTAEEVADVLDEVAEALAPLASGKTAVSPIVMAMGKTS
jgi:hypothetical protein